jgi:hypothetical protein
MQKRISDFPRLDDPRDAVMLATSGGASHSLTFKDMVDAIDPDVLWDKMYLHAKKVIIKCSYCGSHNAHGNSNCVSCGAGMGDSVK